MGAIWHSQADDSLGLTLSLPRLDLADRLGRESLSGHMLLTPLMTLDTLQAGVFRQEHPETRHIKAH